MRLAETIIGAIVLIIIIIAIYIIKKKHDTPSEEDEDSAKNFLNKLKSTITDKIMEIIDSLDAETMSNYDSFESFLMDVYDWIYDDIWAYVESEIIIESSKSNSILSRLAEKIITKDYVTKFVSGILDAMDARKSAEEIWDDYIEQVNVDAESEDKELQNEFDNDKLYYENTEATIEDLDPVQEQEIPIEQLNNLNPQSDDEEDYDPDTDSSVEFMDDDIYEDSNGRLRSKSTGRYVKKS